MEVTQSLLSFCLDDILVQREAFWLLFNYSAPLLVNRGISKRRGFRKVLVLKFSWKRKVNMKKCIINFQRFVAHF